jgi:two-component system, chemotaxis family, chemotaxis protein CheY
MESARVLIVDDLPFMRSVLRDALAGGGFEVVGEAKDGLEGLRAYVRLKPDLVLLDIVMPVMDGITALEKLIQRDPGALVVMCSSLGEQEMIIRAIRLGARDFVVKPFKPERVVSALRMALRRK